MADNVPITAGSGTNIATDDAGAGGHVQITKLAISTDGSATVIPADATNGLDVDVTRSALPSGASTLAEQQAQTTHLDNISGYSLDTNSILGEVSATPTANTVLDRLKDIEGAITNPQQREVVSVTPGIGATDLGKGEDVAHASGDVGVMSLGVRKATPANLSGTDGDYEPLQVSAGRLWASATIDAALPAGTNAIGKLATNTGVTIGAVEIAASQTLATVTTVGTVTTLTGGGVAHDAADSGNPIKVGGKARTTNPTAVADADRVDATYDDIGRQVVVMNQVRDLVTQNVTTITSSTSETTILAAGAAGVLHDLTYLKFTNSNTTTGTLITIRDATAGSAVDYWYCGAGASVGGILQVPWKQTTAANNWTVQCTTSVASIYVTVQAVKNV